MNREEKARRISFVTCHEAPWGGSEELWAGAALAACRAGHRVSALKPRLDRGHPRFRSLAEAGCRLHDLARLPLLPRLACDLLARISRPAGKAWQLLSLAIALKLQRPDIVVLSQGGNWNGFAYGRVCRWLGLPYVLVSQKASDISWPPDGIRRQCQPLHAEAAASCFVSRHNLRLTEEQLAISLPNAEVVRNPFLVDHASTLPWPADDGTLRLACVGRLDPVEKGQDMLLRVLASEKWRSRPLHVDIYGAGTGAAALQDMARRLRLENVTFHGHVADVAGIWRSQHGLVLASRCEGMPLVLVECMLAGRVAITTPAGGCAELLQDGETGFLAAAAAEPALDEALERAWSRRDAWPTIAEAAARSVRRLVPPDPAGDFLARILDAARAPVGSRRDAPRQGAPAPTEA